MYGRLLVPLDGSKLAECVLPHVESIVKGCGVQTVVLLRVIHDRITGGKDFRFTVAEWEQMEARMAAEATEYLEEVARHLKWDGRVVQREIARGEAAGAITSYAEKNGIDLVVMATHGRSGISRLAWGSVAERVLRSATVPVLIVRPEGCGGL